MFYENAVCDGCGRPFRPEDDVVVCPDCGTPQHRECYELNRKCVNEHLHGSGFEWKNPNPVVEQPKEEPVREADDSVPENQMPVGIPMPALDVNPVFYINAGLDPNGEFDGVTVKDAVSYTQVSAKSYVRKFLRSDGKNLLLSWNWGAFFFAPAWFFYRKLYKVGFIFLSLMIALDFFLFPQVQKIDNAYEPIQTAYNEYSEAAAEYTKNKNTETETVLKEKQAALEKQLREVTPSTVAVALGTFLVPNAIAALLANGLYKRKMLEEIKSTRKSLKDDREIKYSLLRRGGVALIPAAAAYLIEAYLPAFILQIVNSIFS